MGEKNHFTYEYHDVTENKKRSGLGIRHLQATMMLLVVTVLLIIRSSMGVAVLAMTERKELSNTTQNNLTDGYNSTVEIPETSYSETYDWDEHVQGMILSAFFWGYTFNQIPGGVVAQKFGAKPVLLASLIINGFVCLGLPFLVKYGGWHAVVAMRILTGLTQCLFPCCHALLGKWAPPQERTTISNYVYAGVQIGTILSMPISGVLARTALGWKMIFYSMAGLAFITAVLWQLLAASSPRQHKLIKEEERRYIEESLQMQDDKKSPPIPWKAFATSIPMAALLSAHIGTAWLFTIFFTYIPSYVKNVLGINLRDSGILSALPFFVMWVFASGMSFICEYICNKGMLSLIAARKICNTIGSMGPALGLVALSYLTTEHSTIALVILCITVGSQGGIMSGFMLNHLDLSPNHAGIMLGITNCLSTTLASFGPTVAGYILGGDVTDISKWRMLFFMSAAIVVFTNIVFVVWGSSERQAWDDPDYKKNQLELDHTKEDTNKTETVYKFEEK